jgi:hypothetical protein
MKKTKIYVLAILSLLFAVSCNNTPKTEEDKTEEMSEIDKKLANYAEFELTADLSHLSTNQKEMIKLLIDVSDIMDELFWLDAIGDKTEFLNSIEDESVKKYAIINYGPWDRLDGNKPFIEGYDEKPLGANYYPKDITDEEFEAWDNPDKMSWYTLVRRNEEGALTCIWYHEAYAEQINKAADLLEKAASLADDDGFKTYLEVRAEALRTDDYLGSDLAWMYMKDNLIDFVVGPIESYEDGFKGAKAAHSAQILIKDVDWSQQIARFNTLLPELQNSLPVAENYKQEKPSDGGDMNVYYVVYYAGDCNSGSKNIAINLPNDPRVHQLAGSRKLQLKNAMQAKFEKILVPISELLIVDDQLKHIKFEDGFFQNVMFHEVAHGLGIKFTLKDNKPVREALESFYSPVEEAKADIGGLFILTQLYQMGEYPEKDLMDNYVTFLAGIFRSVRFGVASSHGKANMMEFYYLQDKGAFNRNEETGKYGVDFDKMQQAIADMLHDILIIQGDGNIEAAKQWVEDKGKVGETLQKDLNRIADAGIPKDIIFKQGAESLGI